LDRCDTCKDSFYRINDYTCSSCLAGCKTCTKADDCSVCLAGYYLAAAPVACKTCPTNCATCNTPTTGDAPCLTCKRQFTLAASACTACISTTSAALCTCDVGEIWDGSTCKNCYIGCSVCKSPTECQTCKDNYYLDGAKCVLASDLFCGTSFAMGICQTCAYTHYNDATANVCNICSVIPNCKTCTSATACTACLTGYFLNSTNCSSCSSLANCDACSSLTQCDQCKTGYYWNVTTKACAPCHTGCLYCSVSDRCMTCDKGYYSDSLSYCRACIANCDVCPDAGNCTTCKTKFYYDNSTTTKKCTDCDNNCATCAGAGSKNCTTCVTNASWVSPATSGPAACQCNSGQIYNSTTKVCSPGSSSSSGAYIFTGILTLLVILLAVF
jgi:hypothetical protein